MQRIPEPEKMTDEEESFYALADYSKPHDVFVSHILETVNAQPNPAIVDLGCGPGDILLRLRKRVHWPLWGIDMSTGMLEIAADQSARQLNETHLPINWVLSDIKKTGLPAKFFDVIISNSVLHHLSDPFLFWQEIKRLARPNAYVFIRDLRRPNSDMEANQLVTKHVGNESAVVQEHYLSSLFSAYSVDEVKAQLAALHMRGLHVMELEDRYLDIYGQLM